MDFLLDPYIISLPSKFLDGAQIEDYLETLSAWTNRVVQKGHRFWVSAPALTVIWEKQRFPRLSLLQKMYQKIDQNNLAFDATMASRACEGLSEPPYLDDEIEKHIPEMIDFLPDESQTIVIPEEVAVRLGPDIANGLRQTLAKLSYAQELSNMPLAKDIFFATSGLNGLGGQLDVKSPCLQPKTMDLIVLEAKWTTISDPSDLDRMVDLEKNWTDIDQMITWAYNDLLMRGQLQADKHKLPPRNSWRLGERFKESIHKGHFNRAHHLSPIFHAIVKVLVEYWPRQTDSDENHQLQRDHRQIQRLKDNALAWRAYVTRHQPLIRLHYWVTEDGYIELSKVVLHNDHTIE